jgi:AP-2 complex subunit alpha
MIATIVPDALVNSVTDTIIEISLSNKLNLNVRRKAILCLTRILKKHPNKYDVKKFITPLSDMFEKREASLSFLNAAASLMLTLLQIFNPESFKEVQPKIVRFLHKLAINKECSMDYIYFSVPNPWLQMKLYKILQLISPPEEKGILSLVEETLSKVLKRTEGHKSVNKNNIEYGLLFEAINLIIHYDTHLHAKLMEDLSKILVVFISSSQPNIRYLGLEAMCRLALKHDLSKHLNKILVNLDDNDISIRRRALDLLYLICNEENASTIVGQLSGYL